MDRALLVGPSPIAVAAGEGGVFVIDDEERSLRRFDASPLRRKGGPIRLPGRPVDVAVGAGSVWVAVSGPAVLVRVDAATGRETGRVKLSGSPSAVDVGRGTVWVAISLRSLLDRVNPRTNALAGRPLTLPFSPSVLSARDLALWVGSDVPPQRRARVDTQTGDLRRDFRPPRDPVAVAAGDDGAAWFAQGEEVPFGRVPVEGDYLDLDADSEGDGSLDVAVGPRGAVYVLLDTYTDNDTGNEGSRTVSFRPLVRVDPRTGDVTGRARVGDEARALPRARGRPGSSSGPPATCPAAPPPSRSVSDQRAPEPARDTRSGRYAQRYFAASRPRLKHSCHWSPGSPPRML